MQSHFLFYTAVTGIIQGSLSSTRLLDEVVDESYEDQEHGQYTHNDTNQSPRVEAVGL